MKTFYIPKYNLKVVVNKKSFKVEELEKRKGRLALWKIAYVYNENHNKHMFCLKYRWQTVPLWFNSLDEAKEFVENSIKTSIPNEAIELYHSYVLSEIIIINS